MKNADELARENEALRERLSRLSEASLRINESLDFEAVLQGVLDSACSLTGARYGVIALVGASGRIEDSVTSSLTSEQHRRFMDFPEGMPFFEHLSSISGPLRLQDFHSYTRSLGLPEFRPPFPVSSPLPFLAAPIRHRDEAVGAIYVGEKEREFTAGDEETLVMFASQAALVIANARRHRDEQRARAGLETLVNTAPVGVLVFDARTGNPVSVNREARRIVSALCEPGGSAEQLLEALTFRRADGREVSLAEFPLAQGLMTGETVRAEEIVLLAPDGRSVTALVNATPIFSEEGEVESVVVTLQEPVEVMTPLEDLERLRVVQVLTNLLSNAARHSNELSAIRVAAVRDGVHVAFSVADDGVGVPAERLPHLFRKFSQLDGEERGRENGGSGLGLAICRGIVEAHGGRIRAESDGLGLGSRFTFTLPAVEERGRRAARRPRRSQRREPEPVRILCVDDDPQTLRYVRDALTRSGYAPVVTGDPEDVPRLMAEEPPRLVLLDLVLPDTDGIELMERVREIADVPVIFLSAYGQDEVIARAFDEGAADYVVKPFSPTELAARIRAALRQRAAPELAEPSRPYVRGELTVDYALRLVTLAGNPVALTATEYRMLVELSANAGLPLTHQHLLERVWGPDKGEDSGPVRNIVRRLRRKLDDDPDDPSYIFALPTVGYRMAEGEAPGEAADQ